MSDKRRRERRETSSTKNLERIVPYRLPSPFEELERWLEGRFAHYWPAGFRWGMPPWLEFDESFLEAPLPRVDVIERDDVIVVRAELPGVTKEDIDVSLTDDSLTIKEETSHKSDLALRPGMTATADIKVKEIWDAVLVPNAALRFGPAAGEKQDFSGDSLVRQFPPRPPLLGAKNREMPTSKGKQQRVWTLKNGQPTPVPVTIGATDGIVTEILNGAIEPGMTLVVEQIRPGR